MMRSLSRRAGFTLIELSVATLILALLAAAAMSYKLAQDDTGNSLQLNATLDSIDAALALYGYNAARLPCPADITAAENTASFGQETGTMGDGNCTGANFINSSNDPDASDPLYDPTTVSQVVAGAVPTKLLNLPDSAAYDPWGRKILYIVDKRMTTSGAYGVWPISSTTIGAVVVKQTATDALSNALTYKGIYALVSFGKNGHGGYARDLAAAATLFNYNSTNSDELKNCHCSSTATATAFDRIFVQKTRLPGTTLGAGFDDTVRYKTRPELSLYIQLQ
jgi:prepilin-type N-terminal cleavage/methylation domain-containing protein